MTPSRRPVVRTLLGLWVVATIGLVYNAIFAPSGSLDGDAPVRPQIAAIELITGAGEATLSARNMAPGDTVAAVMTITNSGRQDLAYALTHDPIPADGAALAASLVLTIKTVGTSCADFDGTTLYDGPLDATAFGGGADGRRLAAATAEILCFRAVLPLETGNGQQSLDTTVTLQFSAGPSGAPG